MSIILINAKYTAAVFIQGSTKHRTMLLKLITLFYPIIVFMAYHIVVHVSLVSHHHQHVYYDDPDVW